MKKSFLFVVLIVIGIFLWKKMNGPSTEQNGIQCSVEPLKNVFKTSDTLKFVVKIKNIGNGTVFFPTRESDSSEEDYVWIQARGGVRFKVQFPLNGLEKLEPGGEFSCEQGYGRYDEPNSDIKIVGGIKIGGENFSNSNKWVGDVVSQEAVFSVEGPAGAQMDESAAYKASDSIGVSGQPICGHRASS